MSDTPMTPDTTPAPDAQEAFWEAALAARKAANTLWEMRLHRLDFFWAWLLRKVTLAAHPDWCLWPVPGHLMEAAALRGYRNFKADAPTGLDITWLLASAGPDKAFHHSIRTTAGVEAALDAWWDDRIEKYPSHAFLLIPRWTMESAIRTWKEGLLEEGIHKAGLGTSWDFLDYGHAVGTKIVLPSAPYWSPTVFLRRMQDATSRRGFGCHPPPETAPWFVLLWQKKGCDEWGATGWRLPNDTDRDGTVAFALARVAEVKEKRLLETAGRMSLPAELCVARLFALPNQSHPAQK